MLLFTAFRISSGQYYCFFLTVHWSFNPAIIYLFSLMCPKVIEISLSYLFPTVFLDINFLYLSFYPMCRQRKCLNSRYAVWEDLTNLLKYNRLVQGHLLQPVFSSGWRRSAHPRGLWGWPQAFAAAFIYISLYFIHSLCSWRASS